LKELEQLPNSDPKNEEKIKKASEKLAEEKKDLEKAKG